VFICNKLNELIEMNIAYTLREDFLYDKLNNKIFIHSFINLRFWYIFQAIVIVVTVAFIQVSIIRSYS